MCYPLHFSHSSEKEKSFFLSKCLKSRNLPLVQPKLPSMPFAVEIPPESQMDQEDREDSDQSLRRHRLM